VARSLRPVWEDVRDATISILEQTTFADLAREARSLEQSVTVHGSSSRR
jgi:DNA-binding IscR family transcriptional regulator